MTRFFDRLPIRPGRAAERVDAELQPCAPDRVHLDDVLEILDVGQDEVFLVRRRRLHRRRERPSLHARVARAQELVRPVLDPAGRVGIGGPTTRRVVLEAAVLGWIVGRRDDDPVGES